MSEDSNKDTRFKKNSSQGLYVYLKVYPTFNNNLDVALYITCLCQIVSEVLSTYENTINKVY